MNEELLIRYRIILNSITNELPDKKYISKEHLFWMLEEIEYNEEQSLTKKHRWLGYIQGILIAFEILDVDEERNITRPLFNLS